MGRLIKKALTQTAIYWPPVAKDAYTGAARHDDFGQPLIQCAPREISVRWDTGKSNAISPVGDVDKEETEVRVSEDVAVGGFLMLGALADFSEGDDPRSSTDVHEIKRFKKTPDLKGLQFVRRAFL